MKNISNTSNISNICFGVLDKLAQQKKKYNRGNNMRYISKLLSWAHMKRSRLQNRFLKNRSEVNRIDYIKRRNSCVSFLRKTKSNLHKCK